MAIRGSLKEVSLPDVLQLLAMGQKTGCLSVTDRSNFGYVYFDRGRISYASIVNRRDRIGDILVKSGVLAQHHLDAAVRRQGQQRDRKLGEILVDMGFLSHDELRRQISVQIEEAVYFLFTWSQGTFSFEADVRPEEREFLVSISPDALLLEGARRVDEWSLIEKKVPSFDIVFQADARKLADGGASLTPEQATVARLVDGKRDVAALVEESGLGEFDVGKALYALATAGFVQRVGKSRKAEPTVSEARVEEHRNLGIAFYKTGMLDEAMREFRRVVEQRDDDAPARFYLGLVLLKQGKWADAANAFHDAASRPGAKAATFHNLAYALERLGRFDEASAALDEAARRGGDADPRVQTSQAAVALRRGDAAKAKELLEGARALLDGRTPPPAWFHYAALSTALGGDFERAAAILGDGIAAHPRAAALHNNLATINERRRRYDEAAANAERGLGEDASLPQLHKNAGDAHYRAARYDDAMEAYQRAVKLDPALGDDVYLKLGNIRYRRQEPAEAARCWERALELDPTNAIVRSNLEAVRRAQ